MKKFLCAAGIVLATMFSASSASAGSVLIDSFDGAAAEGATRLASANPVIAGGRAEFIQVVASQFYSGVTNLSQNSALRLTRLDTSNLDAPVSVTVTVSGFAAVSETLNVGDTNLEFNFGAPLGSPASIFISASPSAGELQWGSFSADALRAVPEPTTMALLGLASLSGGGAYLRRRRKAVQA